MKIFYVGYENIDFGGRSLELIKVLSRVGDLYGVIMGSSMHQIDNHLTLINPSDSYRKFILKAKKEYKKNGIDSDLLFVDTRKATLATLLFGKTIKKKKIIYDMRELRIPSETKSLYSRLGCIPERKIIEMSELVICANKERADFVSDIFRVNKTTVFENIRKIDFSKTDSDLIYDEKYKYIFEKKSFKIIATCGTSLLRGNDKLAESVAQYKDSPVDLILVGGEFGEKGSSNVIKSIIRAYNANNIYIVDKVKSEELLYLINKSDCGIVNYNSLDTNNKFCASGKIYEFAFAKKPVITTNNPPLKRLVEEHGIGCSGSNYGEMITEVIKNYKKYKENVELFISKVSVEKNNKQLAEEITNVVLT